MAQINKAFRRNFGMKAARFFMNLQSRVEFYCGKSLKTCSVDCLGPRK